MTARDSHSEEDRTGFDEERKERARARQKALAFLADMDRTKAQMKEKLLRAGFSPEIADDAIEYCESFGYIDDERYARHYAETAARKKSIRAVRYDLMRRGVSKSLIDDALREADSWDQYPLVLRLAQKKCGSGMSPSDPRDAQKIAASLSRKGFPSSLIRRALEELREQEDQEQSHIS